jgi:hypothetical protein
MTTALFMLAGIAVIAGIITLLDWLSRRKDRRREHHRPA